MRLFALDAVRGLAPYGGYCRAFSSRLGRVMRMDLPVPAFGRVFLWL